MFLRSSVSGVLMNSKAVKAETAEKVREVMKEQHYTPNVTARGLGEEYPYTSII